MDYSIDLVWGFVATTVEDSVIMCDSTILEPPYNYQEEEQEPVACAYDSLMSTNERKPPKLKYLLDSQIADERFMQASKSKSIERKQR